MLIGPGAKVKGYLFGLDVEFSVPPNLVSSVLHAAVDAKNVEIEFEASGSGELNIIAVTIPAPVSSR